MPALQMKVKAITSFEKDGYLHRLCQDSSKISKKKSSLLWKSHEVIDVETVECHEVIDVETISEETRIDEAIHSEKDSQQDIFVAQERLSLSEDLTSPIVASSQAPCPSPLERVSSSPVESKVTDCNTSASNNIGREDYPAKKLAEINSDNTRSTNCSSHLSSHDLDLHFLDDVDGNTRRDSDGTTALDDNMKSSLVQQLGWTESNMLVDMTGNCVMLPFPLPEETLNTSFFQGQTLSDELLMNSESAIFNMVTHHSKICDQALANSRPADSVEMDSFDPILFIKNFLDLSDLEANSLPALLPEETMRGKHITLVLDLDETLVHSTLEPCIADFTIQVSLNMEQHTFYVRQRPFLKTFLERVSEMFEIVLFTASQRFYAEQLLDHLDPDRKFFSRREYRETCVLSDGIFTKDLTVLGVDLAKVAIVDNSPQVFRWQVNNGIPIMSWFDDPLDRELISLLPFLETLVEADDVRPIIAKRFGGKE
ncbi:uncharacterized protein LOC115664510 isoform X2 [Syzygium oleosum]|uniref:uncharacterized protein LOC115664510 isoform X2 n=1 Tax=Syzygium oleosum TaxID=219896 RepID=UPI0011D28B28|nr:uncharacterized protein LOC115664510 isoform X2 [Syzygium oleosum]